MKSLKKLTTSIISLCNRNLIKIRKSIGNTIQHRNDVEGNAVNLTRYTFAKLKLEVGDDLGICTLRLQIVSEKIKIARFCH